MRKLAFIVAAVGALTAAVPASAGTLAGSHAGQTRLAQPVQTQTQTRQADEFSSHRRHWRGRHWQRHRHWHRPHYRPYRYGWHRCRTVWRPHRGWVRICRW
jgi:hypothetical protein